MEQLALSTAALMSYRRLLPDLLDDSGQPIKGSSLVDLDALLNGHLLGNSTRVVEKMVFELVRVLRSFANQFKDPITFLDTVLDREHLLLHELEGLSDQYSRMEN